MCKYKSSRPISFALIFAEARSQLFKKCQSIPWHTLNSKFDWKSRKLFSLSYTQYYFWISTCIRSIHSEIFGGNFLLQFCLTVVKFWSNHPPASGFFIDLSCLQLFILPVSFILFIFNITLTNTHIQKKDTTGNHTIFSYSQR